MNVFTYGTLMSPNVMYNLVDPPYKYKSVPALLKGFTRKIVKGASYPGLTKQPENSVKGVVYLGVDQNDRIKLDFFEGDLYQKIQVLVECEDGKVIEATAYEYATKGELSSEQWIPEEHMKQNLLLYGKEKLEKSQH